MKTYTIYALFHVDVPDAIRYIGITCNTTTKRLCQHLSDARRLAAGKLKNKHCYRTNWLNANEGKVGIVVIEEVPDKQDAIEKEVFYIKGYSELGYDLINTIYGPSRYKEGYLLSDGARANIRAARLRPEVQERMREVNTGKKVSVATRSKISAALAGRVGCLHTAESRAKMSSKMRGNTNGRGGKGRKASAATIEKVAAANRGKKQSDETVAKRVAANTLLVRKTYNGIEKDFTVLQYSKEGEFIAEWPSKTHIRVTLGVPTSNVDKCCKGKRETAGGFKWKMREAA